LKNSGIILFNHILTQPKIIIPLSALEKSTTQTKQSIFYRGLHALFWPVHSRNTNNATDVSLSLKAVFIFGIKNDFHAKATCLALEFPEGVVKAAPRSPEPKADEPRTRSEEKRIYTRAYKYGAIFGPTRFPFQRR